MTILWLLIDITQAIHCKFSNGNTINGMHELSCMRQTVRVFFVYFACLFHIFVLLSSFCKDNLNFHYNIDKQAICISKELNVKPFLPFILHISTLEGTDVPSR